VKITFCISKYLPVHGLMELNRNFRVSKVNMSACIFLIISPVGSSLYLVYTFLAKGKIEIILYFSGVEAKVIDFWLKRCDLFLEFFLSEGRGQKANHQLILCFWLPFSRS